MIANTFLLISLFTQLSITEVFVAPDSSQFEWIEICLDNTSSLKSEPTTFQIQDEKGTNVNVSMIFTESCCTLSPSGTSFNTPLKTCHQDLSKWLTLRNTGGELKIINDQKLISRFEWPSFTSKDRGKSFGQTGYENPTPGYQAYHQHAWRVNARWTEQLNLEIQVVSPCNFSATLKDQHQQSISKMLYGNRRWNWFTIKNINPSNEPLFLQINCLVEGESFETWLH